MVSLQQIKFRGFNLWTPLLSLSMKRLLISIWVLFSFNVVHSQEKGGVVRSKAIADTSAIDFDRRIALVIGNAKYEKDVLNNPVNDANAIARMLRHFGFEVILDSNLDRSTTLKRINAFGDSITRKKGVSFFYYSGHGLQYLSENYMLPLASSIEKEEDIENEAVKLGKVLEKMNRTGNGLNIVVLDACRNNIFREKLPQLPPGLTDKESLPGNTYLFFAASPGRTALDGTGINSPFTESLVNNVKDSMEFFQVVKRVIREVKTKTNPVQQPAIAGSPEDDFIFTAKTVAKNAASFIYRPDEIVASGPFAQPVQPVDWVHEPAKTATGPRSTLHVLSVGISRYKDLPALRYAGKDAMDMARALSFQSGVLYDSVVQYLLTDEYATRINIISAIYKITKTAKAGDMIMFFFAGHNIQSTFDGTSYFVTYEAANQDDLFMNGGGIEYEKIRQFLANAPCKSILFMDGGYSSSTATNLSDIENGVAILASTKEGGHSLEGPQWNNGLFARALIDGLTGFADYDSSGYVNLQELSAYINRTISRESAMIQQPAAFIDKVLLRFKIAKSLPPEVLEKMRKENLPVMMKAVR
jgi:uncharacterized caspase-like protein